MRRLRNTVIAAVIASAAAVGGVALAQSSSSSSSSSSQRQYDRSSNDRSSSYDRSSRRSSSSSSSSDRDRSSRSSSSYSSRGGHGSSSSGSGMTGGSTTRPAEFLEQYRLVLDRNIFSRTRVIYRESATTQPAATTGGPYFVQPALALTGVTREEGHSGPAVAFVEDRRTGRTTGYKVGETIADSGQTITSISLDSIEYVGKDGRVVRVELGHTLEGGPTYAVSSSYGGSATSPSTSGYGGGTSGGVSGGSSASGSGSSSSGSGDSSDILEKLRQRRLQETKR